VPYYDVHTVVPMMPLCMHRQNINTDIEMTFEFALKMYNHHDLVSQDSKNHSARWEPQACGPHTTLGEAYVVNESTSQ
jgi:hypothetical protein